MYHYLLQSVLLSSQKNSPMEESSFYTLVVRYSLSRAPFCRIQRLITTPYETRREVTFRRVVRRPRAPEEVEGVR